jgi:serine protease Do
MKLLRDKKEKTVTIKVSQRPANPEKMSLKKEKPSGIETGMDLEALTPELSRRLGLQANVKGLIVSNVEFGSAAAKAGLAQGDIIVEVDRKPVSDLATFDSIVKEKKSYLLRVRREGPNGQEGFAVIVLNLKE